MQEKWAEMGLKGQLGAQSGSGTRKRTETRGGSPEAMTGEKQQNGNSQLAEKATLSAGAQPQGFLDSALLPFMRKANWLGCPSEPLEKKEKTGGVHSFIFSFIPLLLIEHHFPPHVSQSMGDLCRPRFTDSTLSSSMGLVKLLNFPGLQFL